MIKLSRKQSIYIMDGLGQFCFLGCGGVSLVLFIGQKRWELLSTIIFCLINSMIMHKASKILIETGDFLEKLIEEYK